MRSIPLESSVWYNKCVDLLTVSVTARESAGEPFTLVEIAGEADVTNTDELRRLLDEEVAQEPRTLIVDLSGLRFMDSSALHALLRVNRSLDRQGGVLALVSPQAAVAKILRLTTADRLIPVFDSVAEAASGLPPRVAARRHAGAYLRSVVCALPANGYCLPQWCLRRRHAQCEHGVRGARGSAPLFRLFANEHRGQRFVSERGPPMKIALVAQNATPLHPRTG